MSRKKQQQLLLGAAVVMLAVLSAITIWINGIPTQNQVIRTLGAYDPIIQLFQPPEQWSGQTTADYVLLDDKSLYHLSAAGEVTVLLLEVYDINGADLNSFENPEKAADLQLPAILREGNANGTIKWEGFGGEAVAPNTTIEVKGTPKENRKYHNLKIRLKESAGRYEGQTIINLKKSYGKPSKVEEKFSFDLFATLPRMMSLRTEFVHVYIKNAAAPSSHYESYGLYTLVEQPDENYFLNRSLDNSASLYQAEDFNFGLNEKLMDVEEPQYNKKDFEEILDIKQGGSHTDLLEMLAAVNDESRDIDEVVAEYFSRENLFTWLAMNVILGNEQCTTDGYLLYKPSLSAVWFIIPANMSETMQAAGNPERYAVMDNGCARFYGNVLYERLLAKPENIRELQAAVTGLMEGFEAGIVRQLTDQYITVLADYLPVNPDKGILKESPEAVITYVNSYLDTMGLNIREFEEHLDDPQKVLLNPAARTPEGIILSWSASSQPGDEKISYLVEISKQPDFNRIYYQTKVSGETWVLFPEKELPAENVHFYYRVTAIDSADRKAGSKNILQLADGSLRYGADTFISTQKIKD